MLITIPDKVKTIIGQLQDEGYEAYVVGGCVRDSILGRTPHDWDITTNAKPLDVKRIFRRTIDVGIEHGTVVVMMGNEGYEVTTYRIDGSYEDSRHPSSVEFTSLLSEDLRRRDFTINAMAYNEKDGLVDLFGGMEDIKERRIRAVGIPEERFSEDALRMMRAVRFSAQLGYQIEEKTKKAIADLAPTLSRISAERIREELEKLLVSDNPDRLRDLYSLGITKIIMPEWDAMILCEQNTPHHFLTVAEHTIYALNECKTIDKDWDDSDRRKLRLAMFLHDVAKPLCKTTGEDGVDHFKGHPEKSAEVAVKLLRRLKYDNATIKDVEKLVHYHDYRPRLTPPKVKKLMIKVGPERMPMLINVKWMDIAAQSDYQKDDKVFQVEGLTSIYKKIVEDGDCLAIKDLAIKGSDLIEMGIPSGPKMGEILGELLDLVIDNPKFNTYEKLAEYVSNHYGKGSI